MPTKEGYEPDEPKDVIRRPTLTINCILRILPEEIAGPSGRAV